VAQLAPEYSGGSPICNPPGMLVPSPPRLYSRRNDGDPGD
jgi:hypothetical protein